ncbi:H-NS histone family protein [Paraburkholderia bannensis]|uniref:H-NS histone family protein n=1 Tax=Paraburkholderia bannensis TaxID=765414 RepID=UPI002AAFBE12|nr:H-NS histone family protein [Paraburkholderia bannensis]
MAELEISPEDVAASIAADQSRMRAAGFQGAFGNTWGEKGNPPQCVLQATSAGLSIEHFAIDAVPRTLGTRPRVDWRNDPFAGARLARSSA